MVVQVCIVAACSPLDFCCTMRTSTASSLHPASRAYALTVLRFQLSCLSSSCESPVCIPHSTTAAEWLPSTRTPDTLPSSVHRYTNSASIILPGAALVPRKVAKSAPFRNYAMPAHFATANTQAHKSSWIQPVPCPGRAANAAAQARIQLE